jgi:hypothetical protein
MNQKTFSLVASVIFLLVALVHALRLAFGWHAVVNTWAVPMNEIEERVNASAESVLFQVSVQQTESECFPRTERNVLNAGDDGLHYDWTKNGGRSRLTIEKS